MRFGGAALMLALVSTAACSSPTRPARSQTTSAQVASSAGSVDPVPPRRELPSGAADGRGSSASVPLITSASDPGEAIERAARAACDRETFCDHVGPDGLYGSGDACMADKRIAIQRSAAAEECTETVSGERLGACLTAIRAAACTPRAQALPTPSECGAGSLCRP